MTERPSVNKHKSNEKQHNTLQQDHFRHVQEELLTLIQQPSRDGSNSCLTYPTELHCRQESWGSEFPKILGPGSLTKHNKAYCTRPRCGGRHEHTKGLIKSDRQLLHNICLTLSLSSMCSSCFCSPSHWWCTRMVKCRPGWFSSAHDAGRPLVGRLNTETHAQISSQHRCHISWVKQASRTFGGLASPKTCHLQIRRPARLQ